MVHKDWALFRTYLAEEGYDHLVERHRERGLPETGFAERYTRYAKALVQVGPIDPDDADRTIGMPLELIARDNPYGHGVDGLEISLLWHGKSLPGRRVNVFHDDGVVRRTSVATDTDGKARVALSGGGAYLLSAVLMRRDERRPVVWASHWASLSFKLP